MDLFDENVEPAVGPLSIFVKDPPPVFNRVHDDQPLPSINRPLSNRNDAGNSAAPASNQNRIDQLSKPKANATSKQQRTSNTDGCAIFLILQSICALTLYIICRKSGVDATSKVVAFGRTTTVKKDKTELSIAELTTKIDSLTKLVCKLFTVAVYVQD